MRVTSVKFKTSVANYNDILTDKNEYAFVGRSNVGKSSFINSLTNRKNLAYVGKTPGKTRLLNFYTLEDKYNLVDVPGYGYASLSGKQLIDFGHMMDAYFESRENLKAMVQLVDIRHDPTKDDVDMVNYAKEHKIRLVIVATKADKVSKNQRPKALKAIAAKLGVDANNIFVVSSETKEGFDKIEERLRYIYEG